MEFVPEQRPRSEHVSHPETLFACQTQKSGWGPATCDKEVRSQCLAALAHLPFEPNVRPSLFSHQLFRACDFTFHMMQVSAVIMPSQRMTALQTDAFLSRHNVSDGCGWGDLRVEPRHSVGFLHSPGRRAVSCGRDICPRWHLESSLGPRFRGPLRIHACVSCEASRRQAVQPRGFVAAEVSILPEVVQ